MKLSKGVWEGLPAMGPIPILYSPEVPRRSRPLLAVQRKEFPMLGIFFGLVIAGLGLAALVERKRR
ncbi:hypothetical protein [Roseibium sp. M-1]